MFTLDYPDTDYENIVLKPDRSRVLGELIQ